MDHRHVWINRLRHIIHIALIWLFVGCIEGKTPLIDESRKGPESSSDTGALYEPRETDGSDASLTVTDVDTTRIDTGFEQTVAIVEPIEGPTPVEGERWRSFNVQGKYVLEWANEGYDEETFALIKTLGFNYARAPLDYRIYTEKGDWSEFIEEELEAIDFAVS